jgi:hypothetical protein
MELKKTLQIGKATITISVKYNNKIADLDGQLFDTKEISKIVNIELYAEGNLIEKSCEEFVYGVDSEKGRFGNIYILASTVTKILETLKEMHKEISISLNTLTPEEIQKTEKAQEVQNIADVKMLDALIENGLCPKCGTFCYGDCEA